MVDTIEGLLVRLRPPRPEEIETLFRWYEDPERVSPFDRYEPETLDEVDEAIRSAPDDPRSLAPRWVVARREDDRMIGCVGHYAPHPVLEYLDVWYLLGEPAERGHGYGSEAVGLAVEELFRREAIERIGATCDVENAPSVRLLEKLGFRREGTLRLALFHHGRWHDVYVYGVTRSAWADRPSTRPA